MDVTKVTEMATALTQASEIFVEVIQVLLCSIGDGFDFSIDYKMSSILIFTD